MIIDQNTLLSDIQAAFSNEFQHLRIEFYRTHHDTGEGSAEREKLASDVRVGDISNAGTSGGLNLNDRQTISEFEKMLLKMFGLNVQVFRRSGNLWLQTTTTDNWTLEEANRKGGRSRELFEEQYNPEK